MPASAFILPSWDEFLALAAMASIYLLAVVSRRTARRSERVRAHRIVEDGLAPLAACLSMAGGGRWSVSYSLRPVRLTLQVAWVDGSVSTHGRQGDPDLATSVAGVLAAVRAESFMRAVGARARTYAGPGRHPPPHRTADGGKRHWRTVLGLDDTADWAAVLSAHRRLVRTLHPDAGGSDAAVSAVNVARDEARAELGA